MDAYAAIVSKRDTRAFTADPIDGDSLRRVLQAGRMAGSAKNRQLTRMVVVTDPDVREPLSACGNSTGWIGAAAAVVVFVVPVDEGRLFDIGRMAQNIMVAASSLGLASCPVTFQDGDRLRSVLGLPGTHEGPMGVALGHPALDAPANPLQAPRLPLDEIVHRDRWPGGA